MRMITLEILRAFVNGNRKTIDNTTTDGHIVWLHGNMIVRRDEETGIVYIRTAGWNTQTTRERLKAFTNKSLYQKNHILYLDGKEWDGNWTQA